MSKKKSCSLYKKCCWSLTSTYLSEQEKKIVTEVVLNFLKPNDKSESPQEGLSVCRSSVILFKTAVEQNNMLLGIIMHIACLVQMFHPSCKSC